MGKIVDLSHHQGTIDWSKAKNEIDLAVIRVQDGSTLIDKKYQEYVAACKQYNIPFAHYAFCRFLDVKDAEVEANDFLKRMDKSAKFLVADVEQVTVKNKADLVPATQKFIDVLKKAGYKVGLYSGENFYKANGLSKVNADFLWLAKYSSTKPSTPCDIWQYSSTQKVSGIATNVDVNVLNGSKPLSYFTGGFQDMIEKVVPLDSADGKLTVGEKGQNCQMLNMWLHELTYTGKTDDLFDQYTLQALKEFQKDYNLPQDGIYTTAVGAVIQKALQDKRNLTKVDTVPVKNPTMYRFAKLYDTTDEKVMKQLRADGYILIEAPSN